MQNIQDNFPQLGQPVDGHPLLVVLEIVLAVLGTSIVMGTLMVSVGWAAERLRAVRRPTSVAGTDDPAQAFFGSGEDPVTHALQAVEMGTVYETEPLLWVLSEQPSPLAARARLALSYILSARDDVDDAEIAGREAIRADPTLLALGVELAGLHLRAGRENAAETMLRAALAVARNTEQDREGRFLAHHLYGQVLRQEQRLSEAEEQLRLAVQIHPNDAIARNNYGAVLDSLGRVKDARRQYEEGVRLDPDSSALHANLGGLLMREGHLEEARKHLDRAAELSPERYTAHIQLAALHLKRAEWREAGMHASAAVAVRPDVGLAHGSLARALVQLGQFGEAESHVRRALELAPNQPSYHALLGYILSQTGQQVEAMLHLRQAFMLAPDLPEQQRLEAESLASRGLREAAMAERRYADFLDEARRYPF